jgi:hypothetical protein
MRTVFAARRFHDQALPQQVAGCAAHAMNRAMAESLASLLAQAQESTADILKQLSERCQAPSSQPSDPKDSTAKRWTLELAAAQARVQLRDVHRRIGYAISTMRLRDVITDGEAAPVERELERLLGAALNTVEQQLGQAKTRKEDA